MEVLGGSGYIEESIMPRLYREAPVNSIWEGSGNIMCLDVLRALERTPNAAEVLRHEFGEAKNARSRRLPSVSRKRLAAHDHADESQARALVRDLIVALQGSLLARHVAIQCVGCILRIAAGRRGDAGLRATAARPGCTRASPNVPVLRTKVFRTQRIRARPAQ
jgi:hypothetical protein